VTKSDSASVSDFLYIITSAIGEFKCELAGKAFAGINDPTLNTEKLKFSVCANEEPSDEFSLKVKEEPECLALAI
jgi:hypothetical protein